MKFSVNKWCVLIVLAGLTLFGVHSRATPALRPSYNKVIIYPAATEKIEQLTQMGITDVRNYGSYWLVEATDAQVDELTRTFGARAVVENDLNHIRLAGLSFDATAGDPVVPANLRQVDGAGRNLRLVQFFGPVIPDWLHQLESGGARIISYVPNNAYLVFVDAAVEKKLEQTLGSNGPIQWIGAYHPYYKIAPELRSVSGTQPLKIRVAIVDRSGEPQVESDVYSLGTVLASLKHDGQEVVEMKALPSAIEKMARLADVLWIQKVGRQVRLDEVQDLLITTQTNAPGFGPSTVTGITNYLDFLTNTVAGGLGSFTNQAAYPIVDVADTGLDVALGLDSQDQPVVANPVFSDPSGRTRVAYLEPGLDGYFPAPEIVMNDELGCPGLNDNFNENDIVHSADDFDGHGTLVASIITGYDVLTNSYEVFVYSEVVTQSFSSSITASSVIGCTGPTGSGTGVFTFATEPCPLVTNLVVNCPSVNTPIYQTLTLATEVTITQVVFSAEEHQDPNGFQYGLGVSPFGSIGASRIWSQAAHVNSANQVVIDATTLCINTFTGLVASAYYNGARIENNSWSDELQTDGLNGGEYTSDSYTYDALVRDALFVGASNNVPGPSPLNQEFIVVFAANNLLGDGGAGGSVGGFGDIRLTAPSTAKNVITVGSSDSVRLDETGCAPDAQETNSLLLAPFTAFGPTLDGRFKPEIVAPGTTIIGASSELALYNNPVLGIDHLVNEDPNGNLGDNTIVLDSALTNLYTCPPFTNTALYVSTAVGFGIYTCDSGSSYAAPAVSGAIQLLWWYFENRLTNELGNALLPPSPAMAKAYLCNAARYLPITNPQYGTMDTLPSNAQGMGELDLLRMFDGVGRVIRDESSPRAIDITLATTNPAPQQTYFSQSGQSYEVSGLIASNYQPFRVTLAWTDAPGNPALQTGPQLVNDLDLEVTIGEGSNSVTYSGNNFFENVSVTNNNVDTVNNLKSVFLNPTNMLNGILAVSNGTPWKVVVRALNIAGNGVPNVGEPLPGGSNTVNQDFALVVYNAATNTVSDVPNLATNNACQTAMFITEYPFTFTNNLTTSVYRKVQPSPTAGPGGADEFFKIPLPTPGVTFTVNTLGTSFENILSVWEVAVVPQDILVRSDCGALTELVSTNQGQVSFVADGTNDYYIVVEPASDGPGGTMVLNVGATTVPITVSPATGLTFSNQVAGTVSAPQTATYLNGTTVSVDVQTVSITGSNAADFAILTDGCVGSILNPNISCGVNVAFAPATSDIGILQANLVFTDNQIGSPRSIPLIGTATAPAPLLCLGNAGPLVFSNQTVGTTSTVQSVTITNCGSTLLNVSNVTFSGSASNDFLVSQNCTNTSISAGGTCTLEVTFTPSKSGTRQATLVISDNVSGNPATLTVQGVGVAAAPSICFSSSSVQFPGVVVGSTGAVQSLTLTNCGTAPLVISNLAITAGDTGDFILVSSTCATVSIGNTCTIDLEFAPTAGGSRTATLAITDNVSGGPQLVTLTGGGSLSQPDAAIGKNTNMKKMLGFGVINTTGIGQEIIQNVHRGAKKGITFYVAVENTGTGPDSFLVQGQQISGGQGFAADYALGSKPSDSFDITAGVEAGTYSTSTMAAGAVTGDSTMIRVEITADKTVAKDTTATFTLTFTSVSNPGSQDTVRATVVAK